MCHFSAHRKPTIAKNVITLWSLIQDKLTEKNISEILSTAYFKVATVGNAIQGFKECGIEPHHPLVFSKYDFAAAKTADHDVVGRATENNSANPQTLVVENQHISPPEEPELMANADSNAPKKPVSVFFFSNRSLKQHNVRKNEKAKKIASDKLALLIAFIDNNKIESSIIPNGRSSQVVKVSDSRLACHDFEPSTTKDPPCREVMHFKSAEAQTSSHCRGVVARRGVPAQVLSSSLDYGSKLRVSKSPCV
ncbi:uncharacterized protein TNCV_4826281 [Trichonephila clavipes]|uniref:Uncharacterized protein n=1 Tax=Trichonephila clavipes TaxID=2585209 RepID=A0A8X6RN39_TRICX|nr:uncharacterized protein TNCV_4826281 [Trichonephila clavipes]